MNAFRLLLVGSLVVLGLALAPAGVSAVAEVVQLSSDDESDDEGSMGAELNTFMHSTSASANGSVEHGMFEASFEDVDDPEAALTDRTGQLEARYDRLEARYESLQENETDLPDSAREAQLTRIAVQLDQLNHSATDTERHAREHGVDTDRLEMLRQNASELGGPEVAAIARNLTSVDPPGLQNGPPGHDDKSDDRGPTDRNESDDDRGPSGQDDESDERGPPGEDGEDGDDATNAKDDGENGESDRNDG